jgi:glycosyltransferase involved in cell wall biosynthesis
MYGKTSIGILDVSSGPSGLSRYIHTLLPALRNDFEIAFLGDPRGPYVGIEGTRFLPAHPTALADDWRKRQCPDSTSTGPVKPSIVRRLWRRLTPAQVKWATGVLIAAKMLARQVRGLGVDLLYVPVCDVDSVLLVPSFAGVPAVGTFHHLPPSQNSNWLKERLARYGLSGINRFIAVSEGAASQWMRRYVIDSDRIEMIRNGVQIPALGISGRSQVLREYGLHDVPGPLFLAAGRLTGDKGFIHLIDAAKELRSTNPHFTIAIAGEGPEEQSLRNTIREFQLENHVHLLGHVSELDSLYQVSDCFVLSSVSEALPFVVLEAMARKLPVIATSVGGVPEIIRHGETGWLVPPHDSSKLASAMACYVGDTAHFLAMGRNAQEYLGRECSVHKMQLRTCAVLRDCSAGLIAS